MGNEKDAEVAIFSLLLPAAPILSLDQLTNEDNETLPVRYLTDSTP